MSLGHLTILSAAMISVYFTCIRDWAALESKLCIPANFPDSGGIFTISTILPDFPIGIVKILYFPDFLNLSPAIPFYDNLPRISNLNLVSAPLCHASQSESG